MTDKPFMHPLTDQRVQLLADNPPQALLLAGPAGIGKTALAYWLSATILELPVAKLAAYPYFIEIASVEGKAIGIEAVRELEHIVSLKATGKRIVLISDAHLLTTEAQNAILKTLEEPPEGTILILTSSHQELVLPTIRSRLQVVEIIKPTREALMKLLDKHGVAASQKEPILALSSGLPGLATALSQDDQSHPLVLAAQTARQLLLQSAFEKLCRVDSLSKNKEATRHLTHILMQMANAALVSGKGGKRWQKILQAAYDADQAITSGTQPKLALTNLMLNL